MPIRKLFKVVVRYAGKKGTYVDRLSDTSKAFKKAQNQGRIVSKTLVKAEEYGRKRGRTTRRVTSTQLERHALGRKGEEIVKKIYKGKYKAGKKPVDVVKGEIAYEVKTMSKYSKDKKIKMAPSSLDKKDAYVKDRKLKPKTVAVVINDMIEVYEKAGFHKSLRPGQMKKVLEMPRVKKIKRK